MDNPIPVDQRPKRKKRQTDGHGQHEAGRQVKASQESVASNQEVEHDYCLTQADDDEVDTTARMSANDILNNLATQNALSSPDENVSFECHELDNLNFD